MNKVILPIVAVLLLAQSLALADGVFFPTEQQWKQMRERSLINEPEQKAVVFFSKVTEQLIISPSYDGPSSSFAWVLPVPSRPKVEILKGAIFHELAALTMPKPALHKGRSDSVSASAPGAVTVLERKTVGAYDVSVLQATDGQALMKWLKANKYHLPEKAVGPIQSYVKQKWTFVASRIKVPADSKGLKTGTLAPLRLTFKAGKPVYPLKLSSANPKPFSLVVYYIVRTRDIGVREDWMPLLSSPRSPNEPVRTYRKAVVEIGQKSYPTLKKLDSGEMQVFVERSYVSPSQCTRDMVWEAPQHIIF